MERGLRSLLPLVLISLLCAGCAWTQSDFTRTASQVGATFAAARVTLTDHHAGRLTRAYAQASFVNLRSQVAGVDQQLPTQQGAPQGQPMRRLLALYAVALPAVDNPCLDQSCDWRAQLRALDQGSQAFLEAAGT